MNTTTAVTPTGQAAVRHPASERNEPALVPPVDVIEDSTGITLYADLPGVPKERLNLRVEGDTLSLEGEMQLTVPQEMTPSHAEVQLSRFRRTFTLSKELDPDKVSAELTHGVLRVRIPKAEHAQPRRVEVRVI
ncbi:MAG: heat-shock protein Hsp20 [Caldimonas sp.]|uniref:Hsp20/alpha crystallin family protein n=1 Tax=Caldimonas taiwanensis TaxID=307483 RepID=UPI0018DC3B91|nr:Hsp20/alpha crystallin family protein [Caldimonas taiwanensis]GIX22849.1 MAG: heat-shock protein Hsp20 [Caldimonas sp.]